MVAGVAMIFISKRKIKFYEENNLDPYYRDDDDSELQDQGKAYGSGNGKN